MLQMREANWQSISPLGVELDNQLIVAHLMVEAALARRESCGAHSRTDDLISMDQRMFCKIITFTNRVCRCQRMRA